MQLLVADSHAQTIEPVGKANMYKVNDKEYHYRELGHFFYDDEAQDELYQSSIFQLNQARNATFFAGLGLAVGVVAYAIDGRTDDYCDLVCIPAGLVVSVLSLLSVPVSLLVRGVSMQDYSRKKKKLLYIYNSSDDQSSVLQTSQSDYTFSASKTGVGIVMHF